MATAATIATPEKKRHINRVPKNAQREADMSDYAILEVLKYKCSCGCHARWYPRVIHDGCLTDADGVKEIGVRFLTSMPDGVPHVKHFVPTEWPDLESFITGLHAIKKRLAYATPNNFVEHWEQWLAKPPSDELSLFPFLSNDVVPTSSNAPLSHEMETCLPVPYGAPRLLYDPLRWKGRSGARQKQKDALNNGAIAGAEENDVFSIDFEELDVGDFVVAFASATDSKVLQGNMLLSGRRSSPSLVLARVQHLVSDTKEVTWAYWKRKSAKSAYYVPALTTGRRRAEEPITVTSVFDQNEIVITISPDEGDITSAGFLLDEVCLENARLAILKYMSDGRIQVDKKTRTAGGAVDTAGAVDEESDEED